MGSALGSEGLSLAYRVGWRVRYLGWHLFGPAELHGDQDPHVRLRRERRARVAAARGTSQQR
ncbi:MAG: hypothetical protein ABJA89_00040 [Lapillicoccus sp.]